MISCKKATELISKSMDEPLTLKEELALKIHNFICEFCEQFRKQLELTRRVLRMKDESDLNGKTPPEQCGAGLSDEARERIKKSLR